MAKQKEDPKRQKLMVLVAKDLNKVLGLQDPEIDIELEGKELEDAIREAVGELKPKELKAQKVETDDDSNLKESTWDFIASLNEKEEEADDDEPKKSGKKNNDHNSDDGEDAEEDAESDSEDDEDDEAADDDDAADSDDDEGEDTEDGDAGDEDADDKSDDEDEDEDEDECKKDKSKKSVKKVSKKDDEDEEAEEDEEEEKPVKKTNKKEAKAEKKPAKTEKKEKTTAEVSKWDHRMSCMGGYIDQQVLKGAKRVDILKHLATEFGRKGDKGEAKLDVHVNHLRKDHKADVRFNEEKGTYRVK